MNKHGVIAFMLGVFLSLAFLSPASAEQKMRLTGSGASFPYPLYSAWFKNFSREHPSANIDYQAKGSGAGVYVRLKE